MWLLMVNSLICYSCFENSLYSLLQPNEAKKDFNSTSRTCTGVNCMDSATFRNSVVNVSATSSQNAHFFHKKTENCSTYIRRREWICTSNESALYSLGLPVWTAMGG